MEAKQRVSGQAVLANGLLCLLKVVAGLATGSVALISDAVHSATDLLAALFAWVSIRLAARPADSCHPWGHGKYENLAALVQGVLVLGSAVLIGWQAAERLQNPRELSIVHWGLAVTLTSIAVHSVVCLRMLRVARATYSPALIGSALHMLTDIGSSAAVMLGLAAVRFWDVLTADAMAALLVSGLIAAGAIRLLLGASRDLVDTSWEVSELQKVETIFRRHMPPIQGFHKLRTRRVGNLRYLEAHVLVDGGLTVEQAHGLCNHLEQHVRESLPCSRMLLHVEPGFEQEVLD